MDFRFEAEIIYWRGPAPFHFAVIPDGIGAEIQRVAKFVTYGWGVIPVTARIDDMEFTTSLFPRNGTYLLPLKLAVRRKIGLGEAGRVRVEMRLGRERAI